ncbi:hypothetical protein J1N35_038992 [Gossypium stocksii]|uniref:Uncharacterized protein n=1 Tax=Gossypium stocksii TaxID=47602 RepID=A0A9D3UMX5_9ROSI|nr:hypothetical protein J1N35_038992 [Gossypium stocksii]
MALGVEITEMGWDLSLIAQSRKAQARSIVWLREEEKGIRDGIRIDEGRTWEALGMGEGHYLLETNPSYVH